MKFKRLLAYLVDIVIVFLVSVFIFSLPIFKKYQENYLNTVDTLYKDIVESGSSEITEEENIQTLYDLNTAMLPFLIISAGTTIFYFGILSYVTNYQTLGKKILKIKVSSVKGKDIKPYIYLLREIIITNFVFRILNIIIIINCGPSKWNMYNNAISNASTFFYALIIGFMIFRNDERGLHDLITGTEVIEYSKKK
jgi:uncharacterized RDD family membrane protein YckC